MFQMLLKCGLMFVRLDTEGLIWGLHKSSLKKKMQHEFNDIHMLSANLTVCYVSSSK